MRSRSALAVVALALAPFPVTHQEASLEPLFASWSAAEGIERWLVYEEEIRPHPELAAAFRRRLVQDRELGFLEEIAIYGGQLETLQALIEADAPQWIRVAVWGLELQDSHRREKIVPWLHRQPAVVRDWLERHGAPSERAAESLRELAAGGYARSDSTRFLPPLEPEQVFRHLDPANLPPDRTGRTGRTSLPEEAPEHRALVAHIERELAGLSALERHEPPWPERVLALTREEDAAVRRAACLAFTHFRPGEIPVDELWSAVQDAAREPQDRELALLAWSYGPHARVYVELHDIALAPDHPAWKAALARLGELGDGFTLARLASLDGAGLTGEERGHLEAQRERIVERERALESSITTSTDRVRELLERAAWADLRCHPLEGELREWSLATVRRWSAIPEVRAALQELAQGYEPDPWLDPGSPYGGMRERVRDYARGLISG